MKGNTLKIIDSHFHFRDFKGFNELALAAGHVNSAEHLRQAYAQYHYVHGVVMGNGTLDPEGHVYPEFMSYCIGLDSSGCNGKDGS